MGLDEPDRATDCGDDGKFHKSRYQFRAFAIPRHYSRVDFRKHSVAGPAIAGLLTDFPPAIWAVPHARRLFTVRIMGPFADNSLIWQTPCRARKSTRLNSSP